MDPKGTNGWAIHELYDRGFGRLFKDLKELEKTGFDETICIPLRNALRELVRDVRSTPECSFSIAIASDCDQIRQTYVEWNGYESRTDTSAIAGRRDRTDALFMHRSRVMMALAGRRGGSLRAASNGDFEVIKKMYKHFRGLVDKFPDTFFYLTKSVETFEAASRRAGR